MKLKHYKILLFLLIGFTVKGQSLIYFKIDDLSTIRKEYLEDGNYAKEIKTLIELANELSDNKIYSITKYKSPLGEEALHDYFSDSPYWWPVPDDPTAPYIRYDGKRNPDRFMKHKEELQNFYKTIVALSFASYFANNKTYSQKANNLLKAWFVDEATKMNPNLKYSQMIRNRTKKRGVGIIEGRRFALMTDAINLLKIDDAISDSLYNEIKTWYNEYLTWLTESYYGLDEKERGNNHSTWWAMQVATIASFLNDSDEVKMIDDYSKHFLLDNQFDAQAHQPKEEERTKSLSYSIFNVTAHSYLNAALIKHNINNWNYVNKNGVKLIDAIDYLIPFLKDPSKWKLQQITKLDNTDPLFLAVSGLKLNNYYYLKTFNRLSEYDKRKMEKPSFEPMQIVFDSVIIKKMEENKKVK